MPLVRKVKQIQFRLIDQREGLEALALFDSLKAKKFQFQDIGLLQARENLFNKTYYHSIDDTLFEIWRWFYHACPDNKKQYASSFIYKTYLDCFLRAYEEPVKLGVFEGPSFLKRQYVGCEWVLNGYIYEVKGFYSDEEISLLVLEDFDKERRYFEKLRTKFDDTKSQDINHIRPRIPEKVRIEVWRRDGGKCARCGSREKLEYDHIVPISKGGSNTSRNIELLCEKCNRSKSNNIV